MQPSPGVHGSFSTDVRGTYFYTNTSHTYFRVVVVVVPVLNKLLLTELQNTWGALWLPITVQLYYICNNTCIYEYTITANFTITTCTNKYIQVATHMLPITNVHRPANCWVDIPPRPGSPKPRGRVALPGSNSPAIPMDHLLILIPPCQTSAS